MSWATLTFPCVGTLPRTLTRVYCPMLLSFVVSANVFRENRIRNPTTKNISLLFFIIPPSLTLFCAHPLLDGVVIFFLLFLTLSLLEQSCIVFFAVVDVF